MTDHHATWSPEAEQSVLGALLMDPDSLLRIADRHLAPGDFFDGRHRAIFAAITEMAAKRLPVDLVTVHERLRDRGQADDDSLVYLNALQQCVPGARNIAHHADIVADKALRRAIVAAADRACEMVREPGDGAEVADRVASLFAGLQRTGTTQAVKRLGDVMVARSAHWDALEAGRVSSGTPTGLAALDEALGGGIKPGRVIVLAARPSVGKTSLAQQIGQHLASQDQTVLMVSQEMGADDLADRAAANLGRVNLGRIATGRFEDDDWTRLTDAVEAGRALPFFIDDRPALSLLDIRARARQVHQQHGLGLIIVDYLQLCASAAGPAAHRHHQIEQISRGMKQLAKELGVCVMLLSQLKRNEQREPELEDLKESGSIEEDADVVILLYPMAQQGDGSTVVLAKIPKNRQGRRGRIALGFDGATQRWHMSTANVARAARGGGE